MLNKRRVTVAATLFSQTQSRLADMCTGSANCRLRPIRHCNNSYDVAYFSDYGVPISKFYINYFRNPLFTV